MLLVLWYRKVRHDAMKRQFNLNKLAGDDTEVLGIFTFWILCLLVKQVLHDVELL